MKTGKPAESMGAGGQPVRAYLDRETIDRARQLGNGNFSLGLRLAVKQHEGEEMRKFTQVRRGKNPAFGWIVAILGEDYLQAGTKAEADDAAEKINKRCSGMTPGEVREHYKLGALSR